MSIKTELRDLTFAVGNLSKLTFGDRVYIDKPLLSRIERLEQDKADLELMISVWGDRVKDLEKCLFTTTTAKKT